MIQIQHEISGSDGEARGQVRVVDGERLIHSDTLNLQSARSRRQFIRGTVEAWEREETNAGRKIDPAVAGTLPEELERMLLGELEIVQRQADEAAKAKASRVAHDSPRKLCGGLSPICVTGRPLREIVVDAQTALTRANNPPHVFLRQGQLTRIAEDEHGQRKLTLIDEAWLRGQLARQASFHKFKGDTPIDIAPPLDVVRDLLARDLNPELIAIKEQPLPALVGVVETPILRPDGSVLVKGGYDQATGLFYAPAADLKMPPIPEHPTGDDVAQARALLDEALGDFPYETPADYANAIGLAITPIVRQFSGLVPMALLDAPQAGTGKSLLASAVYLIGTGKPASMTGAPESDEEWRKLITSLMIEGARIVLFDNVAGTLSSPSLAKAITSPVWNDRILGSSKTIAAPQYATWIATGNNIAVGGDNARRCYRIRLNARAAQPWRDGRKFKHPNLIPWITEQRGALIAALLTLCRAWYAAGRPDVSPPRLGSFEVWSSTVGNVLAFCGIAGFLSNLEELYESADEDAPQWEAFLEVWYAKWGDEAVSVSAIEEAIPNDTKLRESLPDSVAGFVDHQSGQFITGFKVREPGKFKIRLGKALKQRIDRRYGEAGYHIGRGDDTHTKTAIWRVRVAGSAGSGGSVSNPYTRETESYIYGAENTQQIGNFDTDLGRNTPRTSRTPREDDLYDDEERAAIQQADSEVLQ